jgi:hypothetical protein
MAPPKKVYSAEDTTRALAILVAHRGSPMEAAAACADEGIQIKPYLLSNWKNNVHAEQYRRIEERYGQELEQQIIAEKRDNAHLAGQKKRALLERIDPEKVTPSDLPNLLKAVTDAEAKSTNGLLQMTGRPTNPQGQHDAGEVVKLLQTMAERGYLALAPGVEIEPKKVENEAERD